MEAFSSFFYKLEFYLLSWRKNHVFVEDVFIESHVSIDDDLLRFREKDSVGLLCFANADEHALLALRIQFASLIEKNVVVETKVSRAFRLFLHEKNVEKTTEVVFKGNEVGGSSKTLFFDWSPRVCTDEFTNP